MRLYMDDTEQYVHGLATSLSKDPASLESWRCMHISAEEHDLPSMETINAVKKEYKDIDCDVIFCSDGDALLISRNFDEPILRKIAGSLIKNIEETEIKTYDLFADWRKVRAILLPKTKGFASIATGELEATDFGEIESLKDIFAAAKKLRKSRQPQYVMLVEDDQITRRLVANAFKDRYAFITASDAHEAIANYLFHAPDIVFLDIGLPDASGFSVLKQIIASDPDAYIVMFSGNSYLDNVTKSLSAGAAGFISKPFKKEKLYKYIEDSAVHHHKYA